MTLLCVPVALFDYKVLFKIGRPKDGIAQAHRKTKSQYLLQVIIRTRPRDITGIAVQVSWKNACAGLCIIAVGWHMSRTPRCIQSNCPAQPRTSRSSAVQIPDEAECILFALF